MKSLLIYFGLIWLSFVSAYSQSRISLAPTYWYNYGNYAYESEPFHADPARKPYTLSSSLGFTARYHFNQSWNISLGLLYSKNTSPLLSPRKEKINLITNFVQLPLLLNVRSSTHRISPYFSAGALFNFNIMTGDQVKTALVVGAGVDYRLNAHLYWLLQPTYSYLLYNPADTFIAQFIDYEAHALGVQTQLIWRLN